MAASSRTQSKVLRTSILVRAAASTDSVRNRTDLSDRRAEMSKLQKKAEPSHIAEGVAPSNNIRSWTVVK